MNAVGCVNCQNGLRGVQSRSFCCAAQETQENISSKRRSRRRVAMSVVRLNAVLRRTKQEKCSIRRLFIQSILSCGTDILFDYLTNCQIDKSSDIAQLVQNNRAKQFDSLVIRNLFYFLSFIEIISKRKFRFRLRSAFDSRGQITIFELKHNNRHYSQLVFECVDNVIQCRNSCVNHRSIKK